MTNSHKLFEKIVDKDRLHPIFKHIAEKDKYLPARDLLETIFHEYAGELLASPNNFIRNFQGKNFNGHLFEIYLYAVLKGVSQEFDFKIRRVNDYPDFCLILNDGRELQIEATTINPSGNQHLLIEPKPNLSELLKNHDLFKKYVEEHFPKKFDRSLTRKLNDLLKSVTFKTKMPFMIAIHDYHGEASMSYSKNSMLRALYGVGNKVRHQKSFFEKNGSEKIWGVIYCLEGTITKFARMAKKLNYETNNETNITRFGVYECMSENDVLQYVDFNMNILDDNYYEDWDEGIFLMHNPNIDTTQLFDIFPRFTHYYFEDNMLKSKTRPVQIEWAITVIT